MHLLWISSIFRNLPCIGPALAQRMYSCDMQHLPNRSWCISQGRDDTAQGKKPWERNMQCNVHYQAEAKIV